MIIGQYESKLGAKRRVAIPVKVRSELGTKLIIARWYERSLVLVNKQGWEKLLERLTAKLETLTASVRDTDRFILGGAFEVELDAQGRIIVPTLLVEHARLKGKVIFVGLGDRTEIWDKEIWQKREIEIAEYAGYLVENISKHA